MQRACTRVPQRLKARLEQGAPARHVLAPPCPRARVRRQQADHHHHVAGVVDPVVVASHVHSDACRQPRPQRCPQPPAMQTAACPAHAHERGEDHVCHGGVAAEVVSALRQPRVSDMEEGRAHPGDAPEERHGLQPGDVACQVRRQRALCGRGCLGAHQQHAPREVCGNIQEREGAGERLLGPKQPRVRPLPLVFVHFASVAHALSHACMQTAICAVLALRPLKQPQRSAPLRRVRRTITEAIREAALRPLHRVARMSVLVRLSVLGIEEGISGIHFERMRGRQQDRQPGRWRQPPRLAGPSHHQLALASVISRTRANHAPRKRE